MVQNFVKLHTFWSISKQTNKMILIELWYTSISFIAGKGKLYTYCSALLNTLHLTRPSRAAAAGRREARHIANTPRGKHPQMASTPLPVLRSISRLFRKFVLIPRSFSRLFRKFSPLLKSISRLFVILSAYT